MSFEVIKEFEDKIAKFYGSSLREMDLYK